LSIAGISKHQYYYNPRGKPGGRKPSDYTLFKVGDDIEKVTNAAVIKIIIEVKSDPDFNYGYRKMTFALMFIGYIINHKKVYKLMLDNHLLEDKRRKAVRMFVKYRKVLPEGPLRVLEMDIKFVWVEQYKQHAFVLTVIDTFTRVVLGWEVALQMKQGMVKLLWQRIIETHLQPYDCLSKGLTIEIRNDNDSRFIAKSVQHFFKDNSLDQVFTHPYTPQENGHIESFHAILSEKLNRYNFWLLNDLETTLTLFYEKYNNHRIHSATLHLPPVVFWEIYEKGLVQVNIDEKKRNIKFRLNVPYSTLSGNMSLRAVPCYQPKSLDGFEDDKINKEMYGTVTLLQPSV
jgi:putative transposase